MSVAHSFHVENRVSGALADAASVTVYVTAASGGANAYGTPGSPVALVRTATGLYDLTSPDGTFADATAYRSHYALTPAGGGGVSAWSEDWSSGSPAALKSLAPAAWAYERLDLVAGQLTADQLAEIDALLEGYTAAIESACGRPLLRRASEALYFGPDDPGVEFPLALEPRTAWPIETIDSIHIDFDHADPLDVVHDSTTLIDPVNYRLRAPARGIGEPAPWSIEFRGAVHPALAPPDSQRAMRLVCTYGYTPSDGTDGWAPPAGQFAVPAPLATALLKQVAIVWQRRASLHQLSVAQSFPQGGGGQTAFVSTRLARSVRELISPWATGEAACALLADAIGEERA